MIQMRALVAFDRNGRHVKAGDLFSAFPIEAASLRYNRKADFCSSQQAPPSQSLRTRALSTPPPGRSSEEAPRASSQEETGSGSPEPQTTEVSRSRRAPGSQQYKDRAMRASNKE